MPSLKSTRADNNGCYAQCPTTNLTDGDSPRIPSENALLFETLCERRERTRREKSPRKGTGRKGTRTAFMEKQIDALQAYVLDGHPIDRRNRPATRAHQCWQLHRDEWDAHVRSCGEEKGFADYKSLGRAYKV